MDVRVGAYGVLVEDGRVLLTHWQEGGISGWTLPGGGLENLETCEQAAIREIREETGYEAELLTLIGVDSAYVPPADRAVVTDRTLHLLRVVYLAKTVGGNLTDEVDGTTDEARWIAIDEIPTLHTVSLVSIGLKFWRDLAG